MSRPQTAPVVILYDGKNIEDMTREELLVVCREAMKELDTWRLAAWARWKLEERK